jgi:hypothetical protein
MTNGQKKMVEGEKQLFSEKNLTFNCVLCLKNVLTIKGDGANTTRNLIKKILQVFFNLVPNGTNRCCKKGCEFHQRLQHDNRATIQSVDIPKQIQYVLFFRGKI